MPAPRHPDGTPRGVTYTPAANYNGPDSFTFKANDGRWIRTWRRFDRGRRGNDAPVSASQSVTTNEDTSKAITLAATDVDNER